MSSLCLLCHSSMTDSNLVSASTVWSHRAFSCEFFKSERAVSCVSSIRAVSAACLALVSDRVDRLFDSAAASSAFLVSFNRSMANEWLARSSMIAPFSRSITALSSFAARS